MASVEESAKNAVWQRDTDLLKNLKEENQFLRQEVNDLKSKMAGKNLVAVSDIFAPTPAIVNSPVVTASDIFAPTSANTTFPLSAEPKLESKEPQSNEEAPTPPEETGPPPPPSDLIGVPPPPAPPMGIILQLKTFLTVAAPGMGKRPTPKLPDFLKNLQVPTKKMKLLNWNKIPPVKLNGTIWTDNTWGLVSDVDFSEIEEIFSAMEAAKPAVREKGGPRKVANVIDPKKSQNLGIILSTLKHPLTEIQRAILSLNEDIITSDLSKQLADFAPSQEDMDTIQNFLKSEEDLAVEDRSPLGKPEQFCIMSSTFNHFKESQKFSLRILELRKDIRVIYQACKELRKSQKVVKLLEVLLTLGNFINGGTYRGGAAGFKIDILSKLADLRGKGNKYTFLHYIQNFVNTKQAHVSDFISEIPHIQDAQKVPLANVLAEVFQVKQELLFIDQELNFHKSKERHSEDLFVEKMDVFLSQAKVEFADTYQRLEDTKTEFKNLLSYFGEDESVTSEEFFSVWVKFSQYYERVSKENQKEQERLALLKKREEKKQTDKIDDGTIDNLLDDVKLGVISRREELETPITDN